MNLAILEEQIKRDIMLAIAKYENQYNVRPSVICGVVATVMCEVQAAKMQEMIKGDYNDGREKSKSEQNNRNSGDKTGQN